MGMDRREFLIGAGGLVATGAAMVVSDTLGAQQRSNFTPMDQSAYRPTIRPPKPDAAPSMTDEERDQLERRLKCQCTCVLDVYTCRTTDFTCSVSPAMHRDVMRLVQGGYSGDEILDAFVDTYGEVALTSPKREGFNWVGYLAPGTAMATGAVVLTLLLRKWGREARATAEGAVPEAVQPAVSEEDMDLLQRALREDG